MYWFMHWVFLGLWCDWCDVIYNWCYQWDVKPTCITPILAELTHLGNHRRIMTSSHWMNQLAIKKSCLMRIFLPDCRYMYMYVISILPLAWSFSREGIFSSIHIQCTYMYLFHLHNYYRTVLRVLLYNSVLYMDSMLLWKCNHNFIDCPGTLWMVHCG